MAKVTGLGGVFYVVKDPEATRRWYREVLGLDGEHGPTLRWSEERGEAPYSLLGQFTDDTYMQPSERGFMINFRVDDLDAMVASLQAKGVEILGRTDEDYGRFAWILDCDGVKLELWQQLLPLP